MNTTTTTTTDDNNHYTTRATYLTVQVFATTNSNGENKRRIEKISNTCTRIRFLRQHRCRSLQKLLSSPPRRKARPTKGTQQQKTGGQTEKFPNPPSDHGEIEFRVGSVDQAFLSFSKSLDEKCCVVSGSGVAGSRL